jgi:hypothetical protein
VFITIAEYLTRATSKFSIAFMRQHGLRIEALEPVRDRDVMESARKNFVRLRLRSHQQTWGPRCRPARGFLYAIRPP